MESSNQTLTTENLSALFGSSEEELSQFCKSELERYSFDYRVIEGSEREALVGRVEEFIGSPDLSSAGVERMGDWEKGWQENLDEFRDSGFDEEKLVPKYYKKLVPIRLNQEYVMPLVENFVINITRVFRSWIFKKYLQDVDTIYEFGCGPAHHLVALAKIFPKKKLVGLDWARSSQKIIELIAKNEKLNMEGFHFNFFEPNLNIQLEENSGVYTFGALEQVGPRHEEFIQYLLSNKPRRIINIEGIHELYDSKVPLDSLALRYHKRRKYLDGYLTRIRELEAEGKAKIIAIHHQKFGNLYDDPHSYVVWEPVH